MSKPVLTIEKQTKELCISNDVYLKTTEDIETRFILLDDNLVFSFSNKDCNGILLNQRQRESLTKNLGDKLSYNFIAQKYISPIKLMKIDVSVNRASDVKIDTELMVERLKLMFFGKPFNKEQKFLFYYEGEVSVFLNLQITDFMVDDSNNCGILNNDTEIHLQTESHCISFINNNNLLNPDFSFEKLDIGGLKDEFREICRRVFYQRICDPDTFRKLGIPHIKGILLYGPPGTGKTLIARQIGSLLNSRTPKIVNGPEILDAYVGRSEENIRKLFIDAEDEWRSRGHSSSLHIIIFDEIDAICKKRGSSTSGSVNDQVVNQLLSKIDGVDAIDNILVIGITNRKDLIDLALLRPGRFELQLEIGLPDEDGRKEIFLVHTKKMSESNFLAKEIDFNKLANLSKNYTGAEISSVVRGAVAYALERQVKNDDNNDIKMNTSDLIINMSDMYLALSDVKPAFGVDEKEIEQFNKVFYLTSHIKEAISLGNNVVNRLKATNLYNTDSLILMGESGSGKTTLAVKIAKNSNFPHIKLISPKNMVGMAEYEKVNYIRDVFVNASKSKEAVIILDEIETLIEYVGIGPRFSNQILQAIKIFVKNEEHNKLMVIGTTSIPDELEDSNLLSCFNETFLVSKIMDSDIETLQNQNQEFGKLDLSNPVTIKKALSMLPESYEQEIK